VPSRSVANKQSQISRKDSILAIRFDDCVRFNCHYQRVLITTREISMSNELVLVTGGSGFVGAHCIIALLEAGYRVRTTVRSLKREADVRAMLKTGGVEPGDALTFAAADLSLDAGWPEAVAGCDYVLHVASPFPPAAPKHENELIIPAREGALRVLRAARDAHVKRVVMTSSFVAIGYGSTEQNQTFTEKDWTDLNGPHVTAYAKSKTLAERAAWDFMAREGGELELSVVNPVGILGPVLGPDFAASIQIAQRLLNGQVPGLPRLTYGFVDVRDVADLHLLAMTNPAAKGERFLAVADGHMSFLEVARLLKSRLGNAAARVSTRQLPDWVVRIVALFDPTIAQLVGELGKVKMVSNEKARKMLGWSPRSNEDAVLASAESLIKLGLVRS
jgi:dihydroflavonol-4-reductase